MRTPDIAIMGDHFMTTEAFVTALKAVGFAGNRLRTYTLPWPDQPMEHGYQQNFTAASPYPNMADLREYLGDPAEVLKFIDNAEVFITQLAPMPAKLIHELQARGKLKLIGVARGGPVNIAMDAIRATAIALVNTPGRNASAVAEFTIGAILAETRLIRQGHEDMRKGGWRGELYRAECTGEELSELQVGVIGYGHIGRLVVQLLTAFGARVLVADPYRKLGEDELRNGVTQLSLQELLRASDVVTLSVRVTKDTYKLIAAPEFALMKRSAYFINVARGPLVDYDALTAALAEGRLRGAMLDTFAGEPLPSHAKLRQLPNVTLTPHIAGASRKTIKRAAEQLSQEVVNYVLGKPYHHRVV